MRIVFEADELEPLIRRVVGEVLAFVGGMPKERIAFTEPEAAALLGVARHVLGDARRRGEIRARRVGKRVVYGRSELLRYVCEFE